MFLYPVPEASLINAKYLCSFYLNTAGTGKGLNNQTLFNLV